MPLVLNIPGFWICLLFWMCQSFGYTRVLNMPLVWICQDSEYTRVTQGSEYIIIIPEYAWLCLDMSEYPWICRNSCEYALICLNDFCFTFLHFPICFTIPFLLEHVVTYLNIDRRLEVIVWRNMRLFSWRDKIWFFL